MKENFTVRTSTVALENVIGNLLKNAIRFTEKGVITVVISKPILSVSDTGAGIAENQLQHIFQRFYRGDASRRHGEGFGLGLSICQNICKREGWNIAVKSVKRGGSTFTVDFSTAILTKK
jgi:signal transduction histidine kinase